MPFHSDKPAPGRRCLTCKRPVSEHKGFTCPDDDSPESDGRLPAAARTLAILALQSEQYGKDGGFRDAVDDVLALTRKVAERAIDEIIKCLGEQT